MEKNLQGCLKIVKKYFVCMKEDIPIGRKDNHETCKYYITELEGFCHKENIEKIVSHLEKTPVIPNINSRN